MIDKKIIRINELAKKARETGLSPEEIEEQKKLRQEYIAAFRGNLESTLGNVAFVDENGNKTYLKKKGKNPAGKDEEK